MTTRTLKNGSAPIRTDFAEGVPAFANSAAAELIEAEYQSPRLTMSANMVRKSRVTARTLFDPLISAISPCCE